MTRRGQDLRPSSVTRRRAMVIAQVATGAAGGGLLGAACGPLGTPAASDPQPAAGERVTLEYVGFLTAEQQERVQALFDGFARERPNTQVVHVPVPGAQTEKRAKMQALVAGGTPPAIITQVSTEFPGYYVVPGLIEELDALMTADKTDRRALSAPAMEALSSKGKQYLIPYGASMELLAYNRALFEQQGVKPPPKAWDDPGWTLESFLQTARSLTRVPAGGAPEQFGFSGTGFFWPGWPFLWGADWSSPDLTRFSGTAPAVVESIQTGADFVWRHHISAQPAETGLFAGQGFLSGKMAMVGLGTWNLLPWARQAPFGWDVAPYFKVGANPATTLMYPVGLGIGKGFKYRRQAWDFIKYVTLRPESNLEYAFVLGAVPALAANAAPWRALVAKEKPDLTAQVASDVIQKVGRASRFRGVARFDDIDQQVMLPALRRVWANEITAKTALEEVSPQVQQLLDGSR
jgi:multiple sugar transport system substrate-binding protein